MEKLRLLLINGYESGQVLIEVLVALGVIVVVVTTITISTATSLSNVQFSRTQNQATQYAQEGMETLRMLRDSELATFALLDGTYCLPANSSTLAQSSTCSVNIDNTFIRSTVIERTNAPICAGGTRATVNVAWIDGKCPTGTYCHVATVVSCIAVENVTPGL